MASSDKILKLVDNLRGDVDKTTILIDLRTMLSVTSLEELRQCSPNISFPLIFESLETQNSEILELCSSILGTLLQVVDAATLIQQFHQELITGLKHLDYGVRLLCIKQIVRGCESNGEYVLQCQDILIGLVTMIGDSELQTANLAIKCLLLLGELPRGYDCFFSAVVLEKLQSVMDQNDTVRARVYELVVKLAVQSESGLHHCTSFGLLAQLIDEMKSDDILLQLNALHLLCSLAECRHGVCYLQDQGVVSMLERMLENSRDDPMMSLLVPGLVMFFGHLAYLYPQKINDTLQSFTNLLFSMVEGSDVTQKVLAIETLGFMGTSIEGKTALNKNEGQMPVAFKEMGNLIRQGKQHEKVKSLQTVVALLSVQACEQTTDLLALTQHWYSGLGGGMMETLYSLANQPFTDLRVCALQMYQALATLPWGQHNLKNHPGFVEYLLDRSTEKNKEGKDGKFQVVSTIVDSPTAENVFGAQLYRNFVIYRNEGPYFVKVETQVALEEGS